MGVVERRSSGLAIASTATLYLAFALTGFATALLGATLPVMSVHWSLTDRRGGLVFLLLFLGSSTGALLSRGRATHSVARGAILLFPACAALAFASGWAVFPFCFLYGLGLGMTITAINQLRSQRRPAARTREMNRLNLVWALGAFSCPWLANELLRLTGVRFLFLLLAVAFSLFTAWTVAVEMRLFPEVQTAGKDPRAGISRLPLSIALATLCATGLESSTGAWIVTYAGRFHPGFAPSVAAGSVFWFGLLASRALHSTAALQSFTERALLRMGGWTAALGCATLLASRGQDSLLIAAFLIGFGAGPIYPVLLAAVLPKVSGNAIFVMAGMGGAVFPLLTGTLSTRAGSLRVGMILPAVAGFALLTLVRWVSSDFFPRRSAIGTP